MQRLAILVTVLVAAESAQGAIIAQWTFETNTPADAANVAVYPNLIAPETGTGNAGGTHASANTDWTSPVGNGSAESFSSNNWAVGDYYEFSTSTLGYFDILISFDHTRSATGPGSFELSYSTDGVTYDVDPLTWSSLTTDNGSKFSFDLSGVSSLDNQASVFFRLVATSTTPPTNTAGTSRVDNFTVEGSVPEPTTLTLWGLGALGCAIGAYRRRKAV